MCSGGVRGLNKKFMQTLDNDVYRELNIVAKQRGIPVQELLRAVILPDWMLTFDRKSSTKKNNGSR